MRKGMLFAAMIIAFITVLLAFSGALAVDGGDCGMGVTWTLDEPGVLIISGNGAMNDFNYIENAPGYAQCDCPWYANAIRVRKVIITEGVTRIGQHAFHNCRNLTRVFIPASVDCIGSGAFAEVSNLTDIFYFGSENQWCNMDNYDGENLEDAEHLHYIDSDFIELSISPETPTIGDETTIYWYVITPDFGGIELSVRLTSGNLSKSFYLEDADYNARNGSFTFVPTEGDEMTIFAYVYYGTGLEGFGENLGPVALQGNWDAPEQIAVEVTYNAVNAETGDTITADYQITGGSGIYSDINAQWIRIGDGGETSWLHSETLLESSGEMSCIPAAAGEYGVIFNIRDEDGWNFWQDVSDLRDTVTVTVSTPDLLLPASLERIEAAAFAGVQNLMIEVPYSVSFIADGALDRSVTIICEPGGYVESRCRELGLKVYTK